MRALTIGFGLVTALSVVSAIGLGQLRPDLFPFYWALSGTMTYFGQFAILFTALTHKRNPVDESQLVKLRDEAKSSKTDWFVDTWQELCLFAVFLVLGVSAGAISGVAWWAAGGHTIRTAWEAIKIGGIAGGAVMVLLFGGA